MTITSKLPIEVELALEVMTSQAMRRTYDSPGVAHPCSYFAEWGWYHSYDYASAGPPGEPTIDAKAVYAGKRNLMPELLSGCRKSPILCVGINPNLPGWTSTGRNAIHPYFDDVLQYAHYFRYRTRDKLRIPETVYEALLGTELDDPSSARPLTEPGNPIAVEHAPVLMYQQYQTLLDGLAERKQWNGHKLAVGEDIAYANMVACPSARWVVSPNSDDPTMPIMGSGRAKGIVNECFYERRYFLRQLLQSLPAVILVFSQTTAREFISALRNRFSVGDPKPNEPLADLFAREIRLLYGTLSDGTVLDARVIFMPHASAKPAEFAAMRKPCVDRLEEEVDRGNLTFNQATGHLRRGRGACVFCANSLYKIGECDYLQELQSLAAGAIQPLTEGAATAAVLADKNEQLQLLEAFAPAGPSVVEAGIILLQDEAPAPPPVILRGTVVTIAGDPIEDGAVYVSGGRIVAVQKAAAAAPLGFHNAHDVNTGGVIYPGLLDLHNHLVYNILPLWKPPKRFDNRDQWQRRPEYRRDVTEPIKVVVNSGQGAIKAIIRYIEVKLLLGGVTSGQGMRSSFGGNQFYRGVVRNFEAPDHADLQAAGSRVLNLTEEDVPMLENSLDSGLPFFFHLAEGLDSIARRQYTLLETHNLLRSNLLCIHSLALRPEQHRKLAVAGTRVVWSPLSNSLLYGQTIDPKVLKEQGSLFGLGSDWTPSGSRNILQEIKVAWLCSQAAGGVFSFEDLTRAVTIKSAEAAGWGGQLGSIEESKLADFVVLDRKFDDPYENLVRATEREVRLVIVGGEPRHGDTNLMVEAGLPAASLEGITVGGRAKSLFLKMPGSPIANLTFAAARNRLQAAMSDLDAVRNAPEPIFEPLSGEPRLEIELDMQAEQFDSEPTLLADLPPLSSIPLDAVTVVDDPGYFDLLEAVEHLPDALRGAAGLRGFYE
jgi:cytosine/adenosine deaminase-related metal-dependent hydrolase